MVASEIVTMLIYIGSMWLLPTYFGKSSNRCADRLRYINVYFFFVLYRYVIHPHNSLRLESCCHYRCQ